MHHPQAMGISPVIQWVISSASISLTLIGLPLSALAQTPIEISQLTSSPNLTAVPEQRPDPVQQTIPNPTPLPSASPAPPPSNLGVPAAPSSEPQPSETPFLEQRIKVDRIVVSGNSVLQDEIAKLTRPLEGREVSFEDLVELRSQITQLYVEHGYVTSGAFLPNNQDLSSGIIQIQIVEGSIERIDITGLTHLRDSYVRSRLNLATTTPLNQSDLKRALQLLQIDPLIAQVNAELTAGSSPGRNVLQVRLKEDPPFHAGISVDNYQSTSIGSIQGSVFGSYANALGLGDRFNAQYGITEGLDLYDFSYSLPVNPQEGTLTLRYSNNDSNIVTHDFSDLGIRSRAETISAGFRQPLERTPNTELALGLNIDLRRSQTYILNDRPFSFSEGAEDGKSKATVIRFSQDWVNRGRRQVFAARSQFSLGIDAFDATVNDTGTDGRFFAWLGQFQYVQQLSSRNVLLIARLNAQLTPDSLLSFERFSLGGVESVRGYSQNQLVADNGVFGSMELQIPLTKDPGQLQLVPFVQAGQGWNNRTRLSDSFIASLGLGLRWRVTPDLNLQLDYGIPLIDVPSQGNSLQDNGLYFSLRYQPF